MSDIFEGPKGADLARRALEEMERRQIAPNPRNYYLWASYVSQDNPALAREIAIIIGSGQDFSEELSRGLFDKYFAHLGLNDDVLAAGGKMQEELASVLTSLQKVGRNTHDYGLTLEGASGQLREENDPLALRQMVDTLAAATREMQQQSQSLENKLKETTTEVAQLRANLEKVREEALTDALTGIANRKRFEEALAEFADQSTQKGEPLCLAMADIDHFKKFNDTWGHPTGDQIIRFVAHTLQRISPEACLVSRYGGEEFALLAPGTDLEKTREIVESVRTAVERKKLMRKSTNENLGNITISIGVAQFAPGEDVWGFVERADKCLYASKLNGRNQVTLQDAADLAA